jgi:hypothetical protein
MTATYITIGLSAWGIAALFAIAVIRGADERRKDRKRETEWRVEA